MEFTSDEAILLRRQPLDEYDLLVTLLGKRQGKVTVVARSARKTVHGYDSQFEPGSVVFMNLFRRRREHLYRLGQCENLFVPRTLRGGLQRLILLCAALEICEHFAVEQASDEPLYPLLLDYLKYVDAAGKAPQTSVFLFQALLAQALQVAGFALQLDRCVRCGEAPGNQRSVTVSSDAGGFVCQRCLRADQHAAGQPRRHVSQGALHLLQHLFRASFPQLLKIRVMKSQEKEIQAVLFSALRHILGFEMRTERVILQIERALRPGVWR